MIKYTYHLNSSAELVWGERKGWKEGVIIYMKLHMRECVVSRD